MVRCFLFTDIPGSGRGWTLAVFAVSKSDAISHVKRYDGGGKCTGEVVPGKVDANCGAVTFAAQSEISNHNAKEQR